MIVARDQYAPFFYKSTLPNAQDDRAAEDEDAMIPLGKAEIDALKVNSYVP